eukprot:s266_g7.t1
MPVLTPKLAPWWLNVASKWPFYKSAALPMITEVGSFNPSKYFEEKYFWEKANVGPFFLFLFFVPSLYRSFKDFYWTQQLRKLSTEEIISDRYEWLRLNMLQDEVETELLKQDGDLRLVWPNACGRSEATGTWTCDSSISPFWQGLRRSRQ